MQQQSLVDLPAPWVLRPLQESDVPQLLHIQTQCYGDAFQESGEVFVQRLACSHHCSLGIADRSNGTLGAYASAYWSSAGQITPLNGLFSAPHGQAEEVLYLHDLSVVPELAGQGMARQLVQHLLQQARLRGLRQAALVAVQGADGYWVRQGFSAYPVRDARQYLHLETYGDGARYMVAAL